MRVRSVWSRLALLAAVSALALGSAGCTALGPVGTYFQHRAEDLGEVVEFGFTYTPEPSIGLYWNSLDIFPFGYSHLDGWFIGVGGGQIGVTRHYNHCSGFGRSREIIGWGEFDPEDESTLYVDDSGILGMVIKPREGGPAYTPACVHFFPHIGYVGFVWNVRWTEMMDSMLGWFFIDISGDDGYKFGTWSFPRRRAEPAESEPFESL